jgi:hypothetical protein
MTRRINAPPTFQDDFGKRPFGFKAETSDEQSVTVNQHRPLSLGRLPSSVYLQITAPSGVTVGADRDPTRFL